MSAAAAATLATLLGTPPAVAAQASAEQRQAAEKACLQQAAQEGFRSDRSRVSASRSLVDGKVEVVLQASRDGLTQTSLTCSYAAGQGVIAMLEGKLEPGSQKQSPYASAKDTMAGAGETAQEKAAEALAPINGKLAAGSEKESPYSAAKEAGGASLEPTLARLWGLALPLALALGSYGWLRSRETM
ncbi:MULTISPECIES: hypothetical protein [Aphanothece]|uniref:hypothetical protein n=1 Tax=Aphanothece TaxID=1121 RepID=UPI003984DF30